MPDVSVLDVRLYGEKIGTLAPIAGDRTLFIFGKASPQQSQPSAL